MSAVKCLTDALGSPLKWWCGDLYSARRVHIVVVLMLFAAAVWAFPTIPAGAQTNTPTPTPAVVFHPTDIDLPPLEGKVKVPKYPNMDSMLNQVVEQYEQGSRSAAAAESAANRAPVSSGASVAVTLHTHTDRTLSVADFLRGIGVDLRNVGADYIEAYVPVRTLPLASQQSGVMAVHSIIPAQPAQGVVGGEGAIMHNAFTWHAAGFSGQGVKVGIIDSGFTGYSSLVGTELPDPAAVRCYTDLGTYTSNFSNCNGSGSHGTAVAEAVIDIAPEATIYLANPVSSGDVRNTVNWMISQDVDVINMSLSWTWNGPGDGTSPYGNSVLRAVDNAVSNGVIWVNSAGNDATRTWFGSLVDTSRNGWHEYAENDECNRIISNVEPGDDVYVQLRWDDIWRGATRDLDLYLYRVSSDGSLTRIVRSIDIQNGSVFSIPREILSYTLPDTSPVDGRYCLAVKQDGGTDPGWIQMNAFHSHNFEHYTLSGSINSPSESANSGMLAVGAANWTTPFTIEHFSSRGPTPDGRVKPDIVGVDGVASAAYGRSFYGTSQASPHVAGLAALVVQAFPSYSPQQVANYLKANAIQWGSPDPNNTWGHGFAILPDDPASATIPTSTPRPVPTATSTPRPVPTATNTPRPVPTATSTPRPVLTATLTATPTPQVSAPTITPTATPAPQPSVPTPTPTVPLDLLEQLNVLEQALATLTELFNSLLDRVIVLEGNPPAPQPTATPTLTPTPRPGEPTATPAPTATPSLPTATPRPPAELSPRAQEIDAAVKADLKNLGEPVTDLEIVAACQYLRDSRWDFFGLSDATPDRDYTIATVIFLNTTGPQEIQFYCDEKTLVTPTYPNQLSPRSQEIDAAVKSALEGIGEPATDAEIVSACEHLEGSLWDFFNLPLSTPDRDYTIASAIFMNTVGQTEIQRYCDEKQG